MIAFALTSSGATAEPSPAKQFSADVVSRNAVGPAADIVARLYVANRQVRIEMTAAHAEFFLIDGDAGTAFFVQPARQAFMDAKQSIFLTQVFVPVDPLSPCRQWEAAAINAGVPGTRAEWRCGRIDDAIIDGRSTIEYHVVSPDQRPSQRWIDSDLDFPVKLRAADGTTIALEHIRVGAQPASLFALPQGYRKFDPRALIERIRHSDVWADSPN